MSLIPHPKTGRNTGHLGLGEGRTLGRDPVSAHDNDKWDISVIKSIPEIHSLLVFKCGDGYHSEESNV